MSAHIACTCNGTRKQKMKNWYITVRNGNYSYFEKPKGKRHYSDYSTVMCSKCGMYIRSKAEYVLNLPDIMP